MKYEEFLENYSPELQLMDALDAIKDFDFDAAEILDRWASQSSNEKTVSESPQTDPDLQTSAPDTQSP
jgi:hypothetical protein